MEGFVYILQSEKNKSYYIGSTINIKNRIIEHNSGCVKSTKYLMPLRLVFYKSYLTIKEARQIEYKLKNFKNRNIIENIIFEKNIKTGL